jgi:DNA-directed RNA polymerase specialized sigma24 family protein
MPENIPQIRAYSKFLEFRNHYLLLMKRKYGLRDEDSEDLFQEAIIIVTPRFNSDRGDFGNFFLTVYENKIKNFLARENLKRVLFTDEEFEKLEQSSDDENPDFGLSKYFNSIEHFSNSLKKRLSEGENQFFEELRRVIIDNSSGFISITARNLGMEPSKGWDIWRKIQRKVKSLLEEKKAEIDRIDYHALELQDVSEFEISYLKRDSIEDRPFHRLQYLEYLSESEVNLLLSYFE